MTAAGLVAVNLLLNAIGSFLVAWVVATACAPFFRRAPGKAAIFVAGFPFLKIMWDACRGVPDGAFLWLRADGATQDRGAFFAGLGIEHFFVALRFSLAAELDGARYGLSGGDLVATFLVTRVAPWAPIVIAVAILVVSLLLLARRIFGVVVLARRRASLETTGRTVRVGRREVALLHDGLASTPYTRRAFSPNVALPSWFAHLPASEREAALAHELGHVAEHHVLVSIAAGIVADVFWFVPGIRGARRALVGSCEASADAWAVRRGVVPAVLASALVRCAEIGGETVAVPAAALPAVTPGMVGRVHRLLGEDPPGRFTLTRPFSRALVAGWCLVSVLLATGLGNH